MTRIGVGLDDDQNGVECGRRAAELARAEMNGAAPGLALLFSSHADPKAVLKGANAVLSDVPIIGATTAGQYSHQGYVEQGAAVMLIASDDIQFHPLARPRWWIRRGKLFDSLQGISPRGLGSPFGHRLLMLFPDDRSMNLDQVIDQAMSETGLLYDILGGPGLGMPSVAASAAVFRGRRALQSGLVGTEVLSRGRVGLALANGWTPVGGPYRITQIGPRRVEAIDGRPAWEVYEEFLAQHQGAFEPLDRERVMLRYPLGVCGDGDCKVSVVMGADDNGALMVTTPPPKGSLIHVLTTQGDAMIHAARRAVDEAQAQLEARPAGALFIDCVSTGMVLGETYAQQREVVSDSMGSVPFLGLRSHGVLARLPGHTSGHFECSVAACLLPG